MDWFLYDRDLCHERVKITASVCSDLILYEENWKFHDVSLNGISHKYIYLILQHRKYENSYNEILQQVSHKTLWLVLNKLNISLLNISRNVTWLSFWKAPTFSLSS